MARHISATQSRQPVLYTSQDENKELRSRLLAENTNQKWYYVDWNMLGVAPLTDSIRKIVTV